MDWIIGGFLLILALATVLAVVYGVVYAVCWLRATPVEAVALVNARFFNSSDVGVGPASNGGVAVTYSPEKFILEIRLPAVGSARTDLRRVEVDEDLFNAVAVGDQLAVRYRHMPLLGEVSVSVVGRQPETAAESAG